MTWGEAAWTASDLLATDFIVTDHDGTIYGRRANEHDALALREALGSEGVECWVVPVSDLEIESDADAPRYLTDCDPGDENDYREPCTCTLACQPSVETGERRFCREEASC
jgi:hypothetical protein